MELEYDYNGENRTYDFSCTRCGTTVRVFEEILEEMRQAFSDAGKALEPLTREEEDKQAYSIKADNDFFEKFPDNVRRLKERQGVRNGKRQRLDDSEAEKLK